MQERPRILCLGMSYPDISDQIKEEGFRDDVLQHKQPSVEQAVECVRRNILTEMDGRDYARCLAMEKKLHVKAYTVSQETGSVYNKAKHLHANFNRSTFCGALRKAFGEGVRFQQVILDYFWIPKGTWVMTHWSKSFFRSTLPAMAQLLETNPAASNPKLKRGVVYLPFCFHCVKELVSSISILKRHYKISFVYKDELHEHALWSGTSTIDPVIMQQWLGKRINQEDIYCTFSSRDVSEAMEDETVTKPDIVRVLRQIENFQDVRMIRLQPFYNAPKKRFGGFTKLKDPSRIQRGYGQSNFHGKQETDTLSTVDETDSSVDLGQDADEAQTSCDDTKHQEVTKKKQPDNSICQQQRLYCLAEDMESYDLLGTDQELSSHYEISSKFSGCWFPHPSRSHWEIEHNTYTTMNSHQDLEKTGSQSDTQFYGVLLPGAMQYEQEIHSNRLRWMILKIERRMRKRQVASCPRRFKRTLWRPP